MISIILALAGLSALVAASPVPEITAAPTKRALAVRLNEPTTYSGCSFSQSVYTNVNQFGATMPQLLSAAGRRL